MEPQKSQTPQSSSNISGQDPPDEPPVAGEASPPATDNLQPPAADEANTYEPVASDANQTSEDVDAPARPVVGETFKPGGSSQGSSDSDNPALNSDDGQPAAAADVDGGPGSSADAAAALPVSSDTASDPLPLTSHKRGKKGLIVGLIIAAVVLLLSGGAAASYYYLVNTPENVLKRALANALDPAKTKTIQFSGQMDVKDSTSNVNIGATYSGEVSNETGAFDLSGKLDVLVTNITFEARSVDGKSFYLKLGGLEGLAEMMSASSQIAGDESGLAAVYSQLIASVNDQWLEVNSSLIKQYSGDVVKSEKLSDSDRQKLVDAYKANSFIVVKEVLPDESVKGQDSHHYKLGVDKAKLKAFVAALKAANLGIVKITDDQLKEFNKSVDAANYDKDGYEVWIAKSSKMISQVAMKTTEDGATYDFRFTVDSYNKPVQVEKPADAKSLLDVMGGFLQGAIPSYQMFLPSSDLDSGISL